MSEELRTFARAALHALRSYQYGNSATDLAKEVADGLEAALAANPPEQAVTKQEAELSPDAHAQMIERMVLQADATGMVGRAKAGETSGEWDARAWLIEQFPTWRDDLRPHEVELAERAYAAGRAASGGQLISFETWWAYFKSGIGPTTAEDEKSARSAWAFAQANTLAIPAAPGLSEEQVQELLQNVTRVVPFKLTDNHEVVDALLRKAGK